jgi:NAD(P)-dependent dehydrogenase (short-subunit alcohol dehydrogenase family)
MTGICDGRVVIVTGAARGIGRGEALEFGRQGAKVVVNDYGADRHGTGRTSGPAQEVAAEIRAAGGEAIANGEDVADFEGAGRLVNAAIEHFGDLHVLVNNAGILRDRTLVNMEPAEWDEVIRVHLRGTFATSRHAAAYWRGRSKAGESLDVRIINTSSGSGLFGNPGQANYGAAKAAIASLTIIAAKELRRYGVSVNAIAPTGLTRMTEDRPFAESARQLRDSGAAEFNPLDPDNVAPLVAWLGSGRSAGITGRVFNVVGGRIGVVEGWALGPEADKGKRWDVAELDDVVPDLLSRARANTALKDDI